MNNQRGKIGYLDELVTGIPGYTWNPVVGCTPVSEGCTHCWARGLHTMRHKGGLGGQYSKPFNEIQLFHNRLDEPLRRKKSAMIGVCFMGDLFHEDVPFSFVNSVYQTINQTGDRHIYLILTKRPERMLEYYNEPGVKYVNDLFGVFDNVWLGVSVEDQQTADERIPILLQIPAAVRWVSIEPMLWGMDIRKYLRHYCPDCDMVHSSMQCWHDENNPKLLNRNVLNGVVIGCESGAKRRPCKIEHIENVVQQCKNSGTPVFVKQAETNGKVVKMPEILGKVRDQMPEIASLETWADGGGEEVKSKAKTQIGEVDMTKHDNPIIGKGDCRKAHGVGKIEQLIGVSLPEGFPIAIQECKNEVARLRTELAAMTETVKKLRDFLESMDTFHCYCANCLAIRKFLDETEELKGEV